ncbi:hypothetical protein [Streptomyces sp. NPDC085466]|uniref:hypothetical protein n=1 Tax=Streptomyces sp. NPDC085466 TaxID=3365725 RepID=UPI0037D26945
MPAARWQEVVNRAEGEISCPGSGAKSDRTGPEAEPPERLAAHVRGDGLDDSLDVRGAVGAPATWVLSPRDVMRHVCRCAARPSGRPLTDGGNELGPYGGSAAPAAPGPRPR